MQGWQGSDAYYVGKKESKIPTQKWKFITYEGMGAREAIVLQSHCAPITIVLEIPVITRLGLKDLNLIGE
jgi:hypothetical protein